MANETEILIVNGVEYTLIDSTAVHTVDSGLSTSSSNPVKNSVITAEVNKKPTLLKFGPYTATLTGEYYTFPFPYIDIGGIAASHDGIAISFSSSSAFRPNSTLIGFKNEASMLNGVNVNAYSGTISKSTEIDSNTFVCILPTSGTSSGGTGYIKEGKANGLSGIFKGYCSTAAATVAKEVTCPEFTSADLEIGAIVFVTFSHTNSAAVASITLNVNGTGAKNIKYMRNAAESNLAGTGYLRANMTYRFVYNGEFWVCDTDYDSANSFNALVTQCQTKIASNAGSLYRYQWCLKDKAGDLIPYNNVSNAAETYTKALTTVPFDPFKGIYWYMGTTTVAAGSVRNAVEWYEAYPFDCRYSLNINSKGTAGTTALTQSKSVYIKAKYTDATGTAVLVPDASSSNYLVRSSIVQDLPTENPNTGLNNGERYIYIYVGSAFSLYQISLESINHVYTWSTRQNKMYKFTGIDIDVANDNGAFISIIYNNVTEDNATTIHFNHFRSNPTNYSDLIYSPDFIIALKKTIPVYVGSEGSSMLLTQGVLYGGLSGLLSTSWTILFPDSVNLSGFGLVNGITGGISYTNNKWVLTNVQPHTSPLKDYTDTSISTAIEALDAAIDGLGTGKTITALSETNGVISAEASDIAIAGSQVTSGTINEARLPSTVVKKSDELQTTNPFAPASLRGPYISKIDNAFYAAPKRWTVTSTPTGSVDPLFNGDYESARAIAAGTSCTFNLKFDTETNGYFPGYPYGYILVSFYNTNIPASVTGRAYCNYKSHGIGWHDIDFSVVPESNVSNTVYRGRQAWYNISEIEITVTADASKSANITQIEMHLFRPNSARNPFLSKYAAETLYYGLTAPSFTGNLRGELNYGTCATAAGTAAKVVTCPGFVLVAGARISVKFTNGSTSTGTMQLNVNSTGAKDCGIYGAHGEWAAYQCYCAKNEVLEFIYDGTYWITITPYILRNYGPRFSSVNISNANGGLQYFLATSTTTTGKTPVDSHILNMHWDNNTVYGAQLAVAHGTTSMEPGRLWTRGQNGTSTSTWSSWREIPRLSSPLTNGQIVISDESTGNALLKGGPALDATDTTKFLRHDGSWAEVGGGVAPVEDSDVFLSRSVNFGENKYKFPSLVGGTIAWNQLWDETAIPSDSVIYSSTTYTANGVTFTKNGDGSISIQTVSTGATAVTQVKIASAERSRKNLVNAIQQRTHLVSGAPFGSATTYDIEYASRNVYGNGYLSAAHNSGFNMWIVVKSGAVIATAVKVYPQIFDLDIALGTTITAYMKSLGTGVNSAGVQWFKQYFPKPYYPFNAGALISVNPTGAETTGVNLFDKSKIVAGYISNDSGNFVSNTAYKATDYISVIGNVDYYIKSDQTGAGWGAWYDSNKTYISGITGYISGVSSSKIYSVPVNAAYMRLTIASSSTGDPDTFSVSVSNPLYNGTYYPYTHHSYSISPVELRGVPKLSAGKLAFDGDVRASDGTVTRKYREVNITSFSGAFGATSNGYAVFINSWGITRDDAVEKSLCSRFAYSSADYASMPVYSWFGGSGARTTFTFILPSTVTSLAEANTWLQNNPTTVLIPLATPTTESSAALPVPQVVYDGGTESYIDERDVQMPVGQDATYMDATSAIGELMDSGLVPSSSGGSSYSEGTFTAKYGTVSNTWNYYKEGNTVTVWGSISNATSMAAAVMTGLPFAARHKQVVSATCSGGSYICVSMDIRIESGSTQFAPSQMTYASTSGTSVQVMNSETMIFYTIGNTATLRFTYICQ